MLYIPLVGDIFDLGFHANRRNLSLLEEHLAQRSKAERASRATLLLLLAVLISVMALAVAATVGLAVVLWRRWQHGAA